MNKELARIIVCLMAEKLTLPSMMLESLEENLIKGNFDKVLEFYNKRIEEMERMKRVEN
jgi:hypothetical protein